MLAHTRAELIRALALRDSRYPGPRVLVPTMGALHAGHAALIEAAAPGGVVSVFLNPLQFAAGEDLERYPRTLTEDVALAEAHGAAVVFAPDVETVFPGGQPQVTVNAGPLAQRWEGAVRPGHFDGVLTVVAKLLGLVHPAVAVFGEKDFQQLVLIRAMVLDLELGVRIAAVPTVRESDGLALSSRNHYLTTGDRRAAAAIPRALASGDVVAAREILAAEEGLVVDYCDLVDPVTLRPVPAPPGRLLIAAQAGATRLLDNVDIPTPGSARDEREQ